MFYVIVWFFLKNCGKGLVSGGVGCGGCGSVLRFGFGFVVCVVVDGFCGLVLF